MTDGVDVLFNTFAKSMAGIGAFVSSEKFIVDYLRYNMRSQTYAKALPMPMVKGALKRLDLIRTHPEFKENLWKIVRALQSGFRERGFDIGGTLSPVTPVYMKGGVDEACNIVVDPARDLQPILLGGRLPGDPQGRNHSPHHPDGRAHARRRELHARLLREMSQEAARRRIQKAMPDMSEK